MEWLFSLFLVLSSMKRYLDELFFFFQAEDGIRDLVRSRGLGDVYKRQALQAGKTLRGLKLWTEPQPTGIDAMKIMLVRTLALSLIHI